MKWGNITMEKTETETENQNNAQEISEKKEKRKAIKSLFAALIVFLGMGVFFSMLSGFLGAALNFDSESATASSVFNTLAYIASGVLICLILYKDNGLSLKSAFSSKIDFTVIIAAVLGIHALQDILLQIIALALSDKTTVTANSVSFSWALVVEVVLIAPIVEEILFRFAGIGLLRDKYKKWTLCVVISIVFSITHFYGIQGFVSTFIFSITLCCVYYRLSNIVYPIAIHMLYNATTFLYSSENYIFGSPMGTVKNGYNVYSTPLIIIQAIILIAVLAYIKLYYIPKYVK
jgi:membrane protease YdiL (CAAX protease family)